MTSLIESQSDFDIHCKDIRHKSAVHLMYCNITNAIKGGSQFLLFQSQYRHTQISGCIDPVKEVHQQP